MESIPSTTGHQRDAADKFERETPPEPNVLFRSKKRSKKSRTKVEIKDDDNKALNDQDEITVSEMKLLKEAQELREQNRLVSLASKKREQRVKQRDAKGGNEEGDDPIGLKQSFAVEKSSNVGEERMSRYIEERMAEKFSDRRKPNDAERPNAEDDLFAIPDRLKVEERPLYDPGEGLPAAGVEEVELSDEVRLQNEEETRRAHKEALRRKTGIASAPRTHMPGNLSANFAKHRSEWMQDNVTRFYDEEPPGRRESKLGKQDKSSGEDTGKRRHYQLASDAAVADRFRKRWKA